MIRLTGQDKSTLQNLTVIAIAAGETTIGLYTSGSHTTISKNSLLKIRQEFVTENYLYWQAKKRRIECQINSTK